MTTMVFQYGLRPPTENADLLHEMLFKTHRYKNDCIENSRNHRIEASKEITKAVGSKDGYEEVQQEVQRLSDEISARQDVLKGIKKAYGHKAKQRSPEVNAQVDAISKEVKELRARRRPFYDTLRKARALVKADPQLKQKLSDINDSRSQRSKTIRKESDAPWAAQLLEDRSLMQIEATSRGLPRFRKWEGEGQVAVQLQAQKDKPPFTPEVLFSGTSTQVCVSPPPREAWESPSRHVRRRAAKQSQLRLRIASQNAKGEVQKGGQTPVWATFPMTMHRPLPENSVITWVQVVRKKSATFSKWFVNITVEVPEVPLQKGGERLVAIDVGWRLVPGGLRVGYWSDGENHGELVLPPVFLERMDFVQKLRGIGDTNFNVACFSLIAWKAGRKLPEWLHEQIKSLHIKEDKGKQAPSWRSHSKLAKIVWQWENSEERPEGDEEILAELVSWRHQNRHIYQWEVGLRKRLLRRRREVYRNWVAEFVKRYDGLVLENIPLNKLAERMPPEKEDTLGAKARHNRTRAAISVLRSVFNNTFAREGKRVEKVPPQYTTKTCHLCGVISIFSDPAAQVQTCSGCGETWDRDFNGATNILAKGAVLFKTPPTPRKKTIPAYRKKKTKADDKDSCLVG